MLERAQNKFEIWNNHKNLEYFMSSQKLNRRQVQWALYLSRFDFYLKHMPGSSMGQADSHSTQPQLIPKTRIIIQHMLRYIV